MNHYKLNNWDFTFILWFLTDAIFNHTPIGMAGLLLFIAYSFYKCNGKHQWKYSLFFSYYMLFCIVSYGTIGLGYAIQPGVSKTMWNVVLRNMIFFYALYQYFLTLDLHKFIFIFKRICVTASFLILLVTVLRTGTVFMREEGIESGINANMQSMLDGFLCAFMFVFKDYKGKKNILVLLFLLLFIVLSGTKKSIISIVSIVGLTMILKDPKHIIKNAIVLSILGVVTFVLLMKVPFIYDMIGSRFESMLAFAEDSNADTDASTKTRGRFIELGLLFWADSPIWGNGLNSFGYLWGDETTYSHNNYVELLCCSGILGLISYYLIYLYALVKTFALYVRSHSVELLLSFCIVVTCLVNEYGLVTYFERTPYIMILLVYSQIYNYSKLKLII